MDTPMKHTIVIAGTGTVVLVVYYTGTAGEAAEQAELLATEHNAGENYYVLEGFINASQQFQTA